MLSEYDKQKRIELALKLFDAGVFMYKDKSPDGKGFRMELSSNSPISPFYLNFIKYNESGVRGPVTNELLKAIGVELWRMIKPKELMLHGVAGLHKDGEYIAKSFRDIAEADGTDLYNIRLRLGAGRVGEQITTMDDDDGSYEGHYVLLIDSLVTRGFGQLETMNFLRGLAYEVTDVATVVDFEIGAFNRLTNQSCCLHSLFSLESLLGIYLEKDRITGSAFSEIMDFVRR